MLTPVIKKNQDNGDYFLANAVRDPFTYQQESSRKQQQFTVRVHVKWHWKQERKKQEITQLLIFKCV